ncbi:M1 family metallopeptidase [Myxococcus stipitatus]|uniref:M1 family metallopeptidase n=1 Tax=Myxococcus stipitatus TaxID=83455 RepID=UPI001F24A979|nr:M1 family metallopeptidase [Myxococcus stipitatus]MCE9669796.1 M1 family metallopeptidase [Myxococcus stipitatus]
MKALGRLPLLLSLLVACRANPGHVSVSAPPPAPASRTDAASLATPGLRLPDGIRPTGYAAELSVDPRSPGFEGVIDIDLEVRAPTSVLWLHGVGLTVEDVTLTQSGRTLPVTLAKVESPWLGFSLGQPLAAGTAKLRLAYRGSLSTQEIAGAFRIQEGGDWYVHTQFEPLGARRVFPSFDEPTFKVPWQLTLRVPEGVEPISNTPVARDTPEPGGWRKVQFARTQPLPTYLIAFGVGPFDIVDAGTVGRERVKTRIITPRGRGAEGAYAARVTPELLARLEDYFGSPFPYEKLDLMAMSLHVGAMEHPGLITFHSNLLLSKPEDDTLERQRRFAEIQAHELGHQWFGNLVTMRWWDDLWLNESFASWIAFRTVESWKPEWRMELEQMKVRSRSLRSDRLLSARRIRQPIENSDDIQNAFDGITYGKGSAVLTMLEEWLGRDVFRRGVRRYLRAHAQGSATAEDFLSALSAEAGRDVAPVASGFIDQGGAPLVTASLDCSGAVPKVALTQRRYLPLGSAGSAPRTWHVPLCLKYGVEGRTLRTCTLLEGERSELSLPEAKSCPTWLHPNAEGAGYLRAHVTGPAWKGLMTEGLERLSRAERVALLGDAQALAEAGVLPASEALALLERFKDAEPSERMASLSLLELARPTFLSERGRSDRARWVRALHGPGVRALGWKPMKGDSEEVQLLRARLTSLVGRDGEDAKLGAQAVALLERWLVDPTAIAPGMVESVFAVAGPHVDAALHARLLAAVRVEKDRATRNRLLEALGRVTDPALVRVQLPVLLLSDDLDPRETLFSVIALSSSDYRTRGVVLDFVKEHYDALVARLPSELARALAYAVEGACDGKTRQDAADFFTERSARAPGGARVLAQILEGIDVCVAYRDAQQADVERFFAGGR